MKINNLQKITVKCNKNYNVLVGEGLLENIGALLQKVIKKCKIAIITDDIVNKLYARDVVCSLEKSGYNVHKFVLANGEKSKNINTFADIMEFLAQNQFTRSDCVLALGGGVVGDIAGFSASAYLRGIKYVQVPTTLLAQIDSSVGGKTAVDIIEGKNLVGAFYQPSLVIADIKALETLPNEVYLDGMGEGVKYAILDKKIFKILNNKDFSLIDFVSACIKYKAEIVRKDEFEKGERKFLNLGHTIAHGIEKQSGYTISHGHAVCMGIEIIAKTSFKRGYITEKVLNQILDLIKRRAFIGECPYTIDELVPTMLVDKKRKGDDITLVLIGGIGKCFLKTILVTSLAEYL